MPHFNLRYFLETLGKQRQEDVFLLQIGAMDGKTFDPVYEYITRFSWCGLLVEPVQEHFSALREHYKGYDSIILANIAIGERDGVATLYRVMSEDVKEKRVPRWGTGLASFYNDRNALSFEEVKPFVIEEEVHCLRLPALLAEYDVRHIDVLQIDTEGHDYHILRQLDFLKYHPLVINLEIVNLPKAEQNACKKLLDKNGYIHTKAGYDLLAVSPEFFHRFT